MTLSTIGTSSIKRALTPSPSEEILGSTKRQRIESSSSSSNNLGFRLHNLPIEVFTCLNEFLPDWDDITALSSVNKSLSESSEKYVAYLKITQVTNKQLEKIAKMQLIKASFTGWKDTNQIFTALEHSQTTLKRLTLASANMTLENCKTLAYRFTGLIFFEFINTHIHGYEDIFNSNSIECFRTLNSLNFTNNTLKLLSASTVGKKISGLSISNNDQVTDVGISNLAKLTNLKAIGFAQCANVTDVGVTAIASIKKLRDLDLSRTRQFNSFSQRRLASITDNSIRKLAGCTNLDSLNLSYCLGISARVFHDIGICFRSLKVLDIGGTNITDTTLLDISKMPKLKKLILSGCDNITEKGILDAFKIKHVDLTLNSCKNIRSPFIFLKIFNSKKNKP